MTRLFLVKIRTGGISRKMVEICKVKRNFMPENASDGISIKIAANSHDIAPVRQYKLGS